MAMHLVSPIRHKSSLLSHHCAIARRASPRRRRSATHAPFCWSWASSSRSRTTTWTATATQRCVAICFNSIPCDIYVLLICLFTDHFAGTDRCCAQVIGKIGTDIQDNKCGWLVIQALQRATPEQRLILEQNYAKHDDACVDRVKQLYLDLGIEKVGQLRASV